MEHGAMTATVRLLGLDFADMDAATAAAWLAARPPDAPFGYVVTPNADHLVRVGRDAGLAEVYRGALLRLMDSRVVARFARGLGLPAPAVATGADVTACLIRHHLRPGERVTILGLHKRDLGPLMDLCGLAPPDHFNPPMGFWRDPALMDEALAFALAHPARFTFLAVGSPQQERLAAAIAATGQAVGVGLCIGASLEFLAGAERRAPAWMQEAGLEWAYRFSQNPRRMASRYLLRSPLVFGRLLRERLE